jgi:hypothetical protein
MRDKILKLKLELKNLAKTIRIQKSKRCKDNNGYISGLLELRQYYRHRHVLYCLARGRTLEQCDSGVGLNMSYIEFHLSAMKEDKKLYVVVDSKLPINVQAVQSAHAVAEFMRKHPATTWQNGTLVLLKEDFKYRPWRYKQLPYECAEFCEPDMNNALTAYAVFGPNVEEHMKNLSLV